MTTLEPTIDKKQIYTKANYSIRTLDDEIRADRLCQQLLKIFFQELLDQKNLEPRVAGSHAHGADYFLRNYMIDHCRENIFIINPERLIAFAGNWYIVSTLEPNMVELESLLQGIESFYAFCAAKKLIDPSSMSSITAACFDLSFYEKRIADFHALKGNEFIAWNQACPLH
jgi:hypothetical protein